MDAFYFVFLLEYAGQFWIEVVILNIFVLFLISGGVQENSILNYVVRVGFNKEVAFEKKN